MGLFKPNVERMTEEKNLSGLIKALLHKDSFIREKAAMALGELKDPSSVKPLIALLDDKSSFVQYQAVESLGEIADKLAADAVYQKYGDKLEKWWALAKMGDVRALNGLEKLLEAEFFNRSMPNIKYNDLEIDRLAVLLAKLGDEGVCGLISYLQNGAPYWYSREVASIHSTDMIRRVIRILGMFKNEKAVTPLLELDWSHDGHLSDVAAWALGEIGKRDERVIQRLREKRKEASGGDNLLKYPDLREFSIYSEALSKLGEKTLAV
jgi:HEAT repeat protein